MHIKFSYLFVLSFVVFVFSCSDKKTVYDEKKDAYPAFEKILNNKAKKPKKTLVIFGANWCKDCIVLDDSMKNEPLKSFVAKNFNVLKVDVGRDGRNQALKDFFGLPAKRGIPALGIVDETGNILYRSSDGKFSKARNISQDEVKVFLTQYIN